ncbi:TadE/TadG family type IV pilus assembly protein [Ruegeria atlantica]|uniref:TadE/TadG family type IV pilus assembly protein n=1 Tax=Ruegeria atlantica TaxID=81569 RepID=UPI00147A6470|nr:TadE/TadG family type IV pilus assembly protein [Ruegeria atlantica]
MSNLLPPKVSNSARNYKSLNKAKLFAAEEDGSFTIFVLLGFVVILAMTGIGVDMMNYERDRAKLQWTLDNAVLAAADLEQELPPKEVVSAYLATQGLSGYDDNVVVDDAYLDRTVSAGLDMDFDTNFMRLSGIDTIPIGVFAAAHEAAPCTEISMALDISGSMGENDRLALMQSAAKAFVTKTLERNTDPDTGEKTVCQTSINTIPFAGQTNPGATMFTYLGGVRFGTTTDDNYFPKWEQDISNVVFWFDTDGDNEVDFSVKVDNFPDNTTDVFEKDDVDTYYHYVRDYIIDHSLAVPDDAVLVGASIKGGKQQTEFFSIAGDHIVGSTKFNNTDITIEYADFETYVDTIPNNTSSCLEMTYADFLNSNLPSGSIDQVPYFVNWEYDATTQNWGWCPDDEMSIQYAQNDEAALHAFIDDLRLFDGTGTNYSLKYALALLDPSSRDAFEHLSDAGEIPAEFADRPLDWDAEDVAKYIVIMTDGATSPQVRPTDEMDADNGTTELVIRPDSDATITSSHTTNLQLFLEQCAMAKAKGVTIFAVSLEASSAAATELRACASSESHYYETTGEEVVETFVSIAGAIQNLRLIQ